MNSAPPIFVTVVFAEKTRMNIDTDIQVWLETFARTQPCVIVPYVKSVEDRTLHYQVSTIHQSHSGSSTVSQSGEIYAAADTAVALSRLSVNGSADDICYVDIELSQSGLPARHYRFDCPE